MMLRREVEQLALAHVPGEGAVRIEPLGIGLVNETYRVMRGGRAFSLRVTSPRAAPLGLDRDWECRVLERAAAAGIAPRLERCEAARGLLIMGWIEGRTWSAPEVRLDANIERIAALVRRIHALAIPPRAQASGPGAWIDRYQGALGGARGAIGGLAGALAERLAALAQLPPAGLVLCHSDLHAQNLVAGGRELTLLDWEYAHVSEPLWDLAGWIANNDLEEACARRLLAGYLGRAPDAHEAARLGLLCWLYDYLCVLWSELYLALRPAEAAAAHLPERARQLAARLRRD